MPRENRISQVGEYPDWGDITVGPVATQTCLRCGMLVVLESTTNLPNGGIPVHDEFHEKVDKCFSKM